MSDPVSTLLEEKHAASDVRCPYCVGPSPDLGWSPEDLRRGHRIVGTAKVYHCYGAYCD